jgi:hypothetical protein
MEGDFAIAKYAQRTYIFLGDESLDPLGRAGCKVKLRAVAAAAASILDCIDLIDSPFHRLAHGLKECLFVEQTKGILRWINVAVSQRVARLHFARYQKLQP